MPSGVYQRKPYMRTYGRIVSRRDEIVTMLKKMTVTEVAKRLGVARSTIWRLQKS